MVAARCEHRSREHRSRSVHTSVSSQFLLFGVLGFFLGSSEDVASEQATEAGRALSWDSPKLREIETEYNLLWQTYNHDKTKIAGESKVKYAEVRMRLVPSLFRKRLSRMDLRQLVATSAALPVRIRDRSGFANNLLAFMVMTYVDSGDREALVNLLASRCPGYIEPRCAIEACLAGACCHHAPCYRRRLRDPILILSEAYSKCAVAEVRKDVAAAVRRGFAGLGIRGDSDEEFLAAAVKWYEQEKGRLTVNNQYCRNDWVVSIYAYDDHPEYFDRFPEWQPRELLFQRGVPPRADAECGGMRQGTSDTTGPEAREEQVVGAEGESESRNGRTIDGYWKVTGVTDNGSPLSSDSIRGIRCVIDGGLLTWTCLDRKEKYRVEFSQGKGGGIDLVRPLGRWEGVETTPLIRELLNEVILGIYELEGDSLRICLAEVDSTRRPSSFKSEEGSALTSIVLKRAPNQTPQDAMNVPASWSSPAAESVLHWRIFWMVGVTAAATGVAYGLARGLYRRLRER